MATYKIVVLRDNERQDGSMPICIRITHEKQRAYVKTPYNAAASQLDAKGSIKDTYLKRKVNVVYNSVGEILDEVGFSISQFSVQALKAHIERKLYKQPENGNNLDFFAYQRHHPGGPHHRRAGNGGSGQRGHKRHSAPHPVVRQPRPIPGTHNQ